MKTHFVPQRKWHRQVFQGVCGVKWDGITTKPELVTCENCKESSVYKSELKKKDSITNPTSAA